jgi:glycosyltransferase involved in cell wall biosynthesis
MRVLLVPYPGTFELVGGHVTQQVETARALKRLDVDARIGTVDDAVTGRHDVVHAFGDIRPLLQRGTPKGKLVVSPIYFPRSVVLGPVYRCATRKTILKTRLRHRASAIRRPRAWRRRVADFHEMHAAWRRADVTVVNSVAEGQLLERDGGGFPNLRVAYSGVAPESFEGDAEEGRRILGLDDEPFVLSVARIEPIKNQVSLAMSLQQLRYRLVLVGVVLPGNERFFAAVREAAPQLLHVPHVDHGKVRHVHAAAAVHALPSWFETTGLSTLEALAAGRPAVVAGGPCVEEYFSSCATLCDPADISSIRQAIERAARGPLGCERLLAAGFSWDSAARALIAAYTT